MKTQTNTKSIIDFLDSDSYKVTQHKMLPKNMTKGLSYIESRGGTDVVKFVGMQYILKNLEVPTIEEVETVNEYCIAHFGRDDVFNYDGWMGIAKLGYFPLRIKAVKEGTIVPVKQVLATIENTHPDYVWLVSWFETKLLRVWYPSTVATISHKIKEVILGFLEKNGTPETINFKLQDFGSRGATSQESAGIGGLAHLINFMGTDTLQAWMVAREYYNASSEEIGVSIPASEHSCITAWKEEGELDAYRNIVHTYGKEGALYACVSDSYNIWNALDMWKSLEDDIIAKGGTLVIRSDSGDPVQVPVQVVERLLELFGYTINDKGYKVLPDYIRVLQGDGIDINLIEQILTLLDEKGISSDNMGFGMGGALLQKMDRDTFKFACKMCAGIVDGKMIDIYKNPITDSGKASKKGFITLNEDFETVNISNLKGKKDMLDVVFEDGVLLKDYSLSEVRNW